MSSTATAVECGWHLYGITGMCPAAVVRSAGVEGALIESIVEYGLSAVVSRLPARRFRPQRSNLAAHHRVLNELSARQTVLPATFGAFVESEDDLRGMLRAHHDRLAGLLDRLEGKLEMSLKVFWERGSIFESFEASRRELKDTRDRPVRQGGRWSPELKIDLGRRFGPRLEQSRQRRTRHIVEALSPFSVEIRTIDPGTERMIMKLACLIRRDRQAEWEEGVQQAARLFDGRYRLDSSGPWPPFTFAGFDLELGTYPRTCPGSV